MLVTNRWAGHLRRGMWVCIAYATNPAVICPAIVDRPADGDRWWLIVYAAPDVGLPQMYREDEILGIPALGFAMDVVRDGDPEAWQGFPATPGHEITSEPVQKMDANGPLYRWRCRCGRVGQGLYNTAERAERDGADHVLAKSVGRGPEPPPY